MAKDDHDSLSKLMQLYDGLQGGGRISARDTASDLGVSKRTIQRYVDKLTRAGVPLVYEDLADGSRSYTLPRTSRGFLLKLGLEQVMALHVALGWLRQFEGSVIFDSLETLRAQVLQWLEDRQEKEREGRRWDAQKFLALPFLPFTYDLGSDVFDDVVTCLLREQKLRFTYEAMNGQRRTHTVKPYTLLYTKGAFYLVALLDQAKPGYRPTTFHLSRMTRSERLRERYEYPEDWDPGTLSPSLSGLLGAEVGDLDVTFDARFHRHIAKERRWPRGTRVTREGDRVRLRMRIPLSEEVLDWLLGFTPPVEILGPPELRERIVERARDLLRAHHATL